jgi:hypothetical protein
LSGEISVFFPFCAQPNLLKGWNSFSSILKEGISLDEMNLYCNPAAIYRWDANSNQYIMEKNRIEAGVGYYIAQVNGCTLLNIPGNPYTLVPMNLSAGKYYFIGSQYNIVNVADIAGNCPLDNLTFQTRNYSSSDYVKVDKIEPWKSYWIKSDVDCTFGLEKEQSCINSGGTIGTSLCCKSVSDFPNSCMIGACGCSPDNSHSVKICECPEGKCFDGNKCV